MTKIDLLNLNACVLDRFNKEINRSIHHRKLLTDICSDERMARESEIYKISVPDIDRAKMIYILRTKSYVDEYLHILKTPFDTACHKSRTMAARKKEIVTIVSNVVLDVILHYRWFDIKLTNSPSIHDACTRCYTCDNTCQNDFEIDENNKKTCLRCSREINTIETGHTHQDYNRVNIISKFVHNRVLHLQECIKQFQGKQNCKIPDDVYDDLNKKFATYRLLIDSDNYHVRYSKITPQHISIFLKELGYTKHYKNVNAIYYILTNKRVADISHLEHKLIEDFKELVFLYNSLHTKDKPEELERKNFMNVHYLLFQLLKRHGYNCKIDDFSMLKTIDRKIFHDKICGNLFGKLGWNFIPIF